MSQIGYKKMNSDASRHLEQKSHDHTLKFLSDFRKKRDALKFNTNENKSQELFPRVITSLQQNEPLTENTLT